MDYNALFGCDCGLVVEVVEKCACGDGCQPVCCGKPMRRLVENTVEAAREKHIPVLERIPGGFQVRVGSVDHPMTPEHYITMIELLEGNQVLRHKLSPTDQPAAIFHTGALSVTARAYCNLHGLWAASQ